MKRIFKSVSVILLLLIFTVPKTQAAYDPTEGKTFDVTMEVGKDGVVKVNTTLTVDFVEERQGIFVSLPTMYTGYNFSGFTGNENDDNKTYYFPIENFRSLTHEYVLDNSSTQGQVYRLGTKGHFLKGIEVFEYAYEIHTKDLHLSTGDQMFLMNLIGDEWNFDFDKINFEVIFDKRFKDSPVKFEFSDGTSLTEFTQTDSTIKGEYVGSVGYGQALTVFVDLPKDYFTFKNLDYSFLTIIIGGLFALIVSIWHNNIDEDREIIDYIEWNPPKGFNSADVGYVHRGGLASEKDIVSLIIYWADKGYLKLEEKDKKNTILHKVKDIDPGVKDYERKLFNELFYKRDKVSTKSLQQSFYPHFNAATHNLSYYYKGENSIFDSKSVTLTILGSILGIIVFALFALVLNYARFGYVRVVSLETGLFAVPILLLVILGAAIRSSELRQTKGNKVKKFFLVLGCVFMLGYVYIISLGFYVNGLFMLLGTVLALKGIYTVSQATQYTENGNEWMGQILGMKDFIQSVELEQLELLVEEEPYLFYNVLPFAYVLGLSNRWIKKFETIAIPPSTWYVTPMRYHPRMYRNLNSTMNNLNQSMTSVPPSKGSSGGGFSGGSSGGGSFGGGGFGGGGGGSW